MDNLVSFHLDQGDFQRLLAPSINQLSCANRNPRRRLPGSYDRVMTVMTAEEIRLRLRMASSIL